MKFAMLAIAAVLLAPPALGYGFDPGHGHGTLAPDIRVHAAFVKHHAILRIREEGIKLQAEDGGKLTSAHREYLQAKLNAVLNGNY